MAMPDCRWSLASDHSPFIIYHYASGNSYVVVSCFIPVIIDRYKIETATVYLTLSSIPQLLRQLLC